MYCFIKTSCRKPSLTIIARILCKRTFSEYVRIFNILQISHWSIVSIATDSKIFSHLFGIWHKISSLLYLGKTGFPWFQRKNRLKNNNSLFFSDIRIWRSYYALLVIDDVTGLLFFNFYIRRNKHFWIALGIIELQISYLHFFLIQI